MIVALPGLFSYLFLVLVPSGGRKMFSLRQYYNIVYMFWNYLIFRYLENTLTLEKHTYSNILKISLSKNETFNVKYSDMFHISARNIDCGYSVLTSIHNL